MFKFVSLSKKSFFLDTKLFLPQHLSYRFYKNRQYYSHSNSNLSCPEEKNAGITEYLKEGIVLNAVMKHR